MNEVEVQLNASKWTIVDRLGGGGYGDVYRVFEATTGDEAAAKCFPKLPGAERELEFENIQDGVNIVPVIDQGATEDHYWIVMPMGDMSLQDRMDDDTAIDLPEAISILTDIANALVFIEGRVVHRDLKPANVILVDGTWCLADFGTARYAEKATATHTRRHAFTPDYAAPELWRSQRATSKTDIYAFGIIAYELLSGELPFTGRTEAELQEQHCGGQRPTLRTTPHSLTALVSDCLFVAQEARPTASRILQVLGSVGRPVLPGIVELQAANRQQAVVRSAEDVRRSQEQRDRERRSELQDASQTLFRRIVGRFTDTIEEHAPTARVNANGGGLEVSLGSASLSIFQAMPVGLDAWGGIQAPAFEVISASRIMLRIPPNNYGYSGRTHSLWFGDLQREGEFAWFDLSFMWNPVMKRQANYRPMFLDPGDLAANAFVRGIMETQLASPARKVDDESIDAYVAEWLGRLARASGGAVEMPHQLPESLTDGSWRRRP